MNWQSVRDSWDELRDSFKARWPRLTDDDLERVDGGMDAMVAVLRQRYGIAPEDALRQLAEFSDAVDERFENWRLRRASPTAD